MAQFWDLGGIYRVKLDFGLCYGLCVSIQGFLLYEYIVEYVGCCQGSPVGQEMMNI
jgi:hypothetical protein